MRLAVLSDIHGNADALAAVLADVRVAAPDATVNLGDCFSGPLDVARTADLLANARIAVTVRRNHDRYLLDPALMDSWDKSAQPHLSAATLAWLATCPPPPRWAIRSCATPRQKTTCPIGKRRIPPMVSRAAHLWPTSPPLPTAFRKA